MVAIKPEIMSTQIQFPLAYSGNWNNNITSHQAETESPTVLKNISEKATLKRSLAAILKILESKWLQMHDRHTPVTMQIS